MFTKMYKMGKYGCTAQKINDLIITKEYSHYKVT